MPDDIVGKGKSILETHGYELGKELGSGSYANVYSAYSARHKQDVAIKIISKRKSPAEYIKKFIPRELEIARHVRHPNIICFLQTIETTSRIYLIMEQAKGGDLLHAIARDKTIDEPRSRRWFLQLVQALNFCHSNGIVHRDIKCENLLLNSEQNIKITDFGFARMDYIKDGEIPFSETFCGSYAYAAPEILHGERYDGRLADLWSCGIILFAMIIGRLPFDDSNHKELLKSVQKGVVFPKNKPISDGAKDLIIKLLVKVTDRLRYVDIVIHPWCEIKEKKELIAASGDDFKVPTLKVSITPSTPSPTEEMATTETPPLSSIQTRLSSLSEPLSSS